MPKKTIQPDHLKLIQLRHSKGWTQADLAAQADCGKRTVENAERGNSVHASTLARLAAAIGVSVESLLLDAKSPEQDHFSPIGLLLSDNLEDWTRLWLSGANPIWEYVRAQNGQLSHEDLQFISDSRNRHLDSHLSKIGAGKGVIESLKLRYSAVCNALVAADGLSRWRKHGSFSAEIQDAAANSIQQFDLALPISSRERLKLNQITVDSPTLVDALVQETLPSHDAGPSAVLAFRRLLHYLLGYPDSKCQGQARSAAIALDDGGQGVLIHIDVAKRTEGYSSCYIDPVGIGLHPLSKDTLQSVSDAWLTASRAATSEAFIERGEAFRLNFEAPSGFSISGGSLGVSMACAMFAAASNQKLSSRTLVVAGLQGSGSELIEGVSHAVAKVIAAKDQGIGQIVVQAEQDLESPVDGIQILKARSIQDCVELATDKTARIEAILRRIKSAGKRRNVDQGYIQPNISVLGSSIGKHDNSPAVSPPTEVTESRLDPGHFRSHRLGDDWSIEDFGNRLCIIGNAGIGKTSLAHHISSRYETHRDVSQGGPSLVQFIDAQNWPTDIRAEIVHRIEVLAGVSREEAEMVLSYCLQHGRLNLTIDGFDQAELRTQGTIMAAIRSPEFSNCHIIVASRPYAVSRWKDEFSQGDTWEFAQIEDFSKEQMRQFLGEDLWQRLSGFPDEILRVPRVLSMLKNANDKDIEGVRSVDDIVLHAVRWSIRRDAKSRDKGHRWIQKHEEFLCNLAFELALADEFSGAGRELIERCARKCQLELSDAFEIASSDAGLLTFSDDFSSHVSFNNLLTLEVLAGQRLAAPLDEATIEQVVHKVVSDQWRVITLSAIRKLKKSRLPTLPSWISSLFTSVQGVRRPTELIYESWSILESDSAGKEIIKEFCLNERLHSAECRNRIAVGKDFVADSVVTNEEYQEFDAEFQGGVDGTAIVSWYDAWCFCAWNRCVLPTTGNLSEADTHGGKLQAEEWTQDSGDEKHQLKRFRMCWEDAGVN